MRGDRVTQLLLAAALVAGGGGALFAAAAVDTPRTPQRADAVAVGSDITDGSAPGLTLGRSVPVRLDIPAIGVHAGLVTLGVQPDRSVAVPPLGSRDAGWYEHSPTPGEVGPAVLLGHVDSARGPGVFYNLRMLMPGDVVRVTRADGTVAAFRVDRIGHYPKSAFPTAAIYGDIDHPGAAADHLRRGLRQVGTQLSGQCCGVRLGSRVISADEPAFEAFVLAHGPELVAFARRLTLDHHRAEDIVQDVLARIGLAWARTSQIADLRAYAHKAVLHEFLSWRRRRSSSERVTDRPDPGRSTVDDVAAVVLRDELQQLFGVLPPVQRAVLVLRYYLDRPDDEIAAMLGCRQSTVRSHARRARTTLHATRSEGARR